MVKEASEKPQKEPGVQSIRRAFAILEAVALSPEGITLAQLSKMVDLHTSTTFHLAKTMVAMGIIRQDEDSKGYHIGAPPVWSCRRCHGRNGTGSAGPAHPR